MVKRNLAENCPKLPKTPKSELLTLVGQHKSKVLADPYVLIFRKHNKKLFKGIDFALTKDSLREM